MYESAVAGFAGVSPGHTMTLCAMKESRLPEMGWRSAFICQTYGLLYDVTKLGV